MVRRSFEAVLASEVSSLDLPAPRASPPAASTLDTNTSDPPALAAFWAVALLPALKYPSNPPGVAEQEVGIGRRRDHAAFTELDAAHVAIAYSGKGVRVTGTRATRAFMSAAVSKPSEIKVALSPVPIP